MKCPNCGSENKDTVKFCFKCGTKFSQDKFQNAIPKPNNNLQTSPVMDAHMADLSTRPLVVASLIFKDSGKDIIIPFKPLVYIGRTDTQGSNLPDIDLTEVDMGRVTSRKHGYITYSNGRYKLADSGSMNGTFINGNKLEKGKEYDIKNGDEIIFGKLVCVFSCTE